MLNANITKRLTSPKSILAFNLSLPIAERIHDLPGQLRNKARYEEALKFRALIERENEPKRQAKRQAEDAMAAIGSKLRGKEFRGYEQQQTGGLEVRSTGTNPSDFSEENNPFTFALKAGLSKAENETKSISNAVYQGETSGLLAA